MAARKIVFNAVSAKMGGAATYLRMVLAEIHQRDIQLEIIVLAHPEQIEAMHQAAPSFQIMSIAFQGGGFDLLWFDPMGLRQFLRRERVDALFSTANFAMVEAPCPQLLLVRNALYFSEVYRSRILPTKPLRSRAEDEIRRVLTILSA